MKIFSALLFALAFCTASAVESDLNLQSASSYTYTYTYTTPSSTYKPVYTPTSYSYNSYSYSTHSSFSLNPLCPYGCSINGFCGSHYQCTFNYMLILMDVALVLIGLATVYCYVICQRNKRRRMIAKTRYPFSLECNTEDVSYYLEIS